MSRLPTGTITFLFTDIEGSSAAWERAPEAMARAVTDHDRLLKSAFAGHNGSVFKALGDGFACTFARPADALAAVIAAQRALTQHAWPAEIGALRVRMALHSGSAVVTGKDYFGPTVNRAARLMSLASGEQILVSSSTAALLRDCLNEDVSLRELGSYRLKDLSLPETTFQVVAPGLRGEFPPISDVDSRANNLPFQTSGFVGREREISELGDLLRDRRIVTIAGTGGIGKTRLALQLASEMIHEFPHGAWFVDLSGLADPALIEQSIAEALAVRESPAEPLSTTILNHLRERKLLLVIDNAEHLLSGVAHAVRALTSRCAHLCVLTTSREPLHVEGEYVYRLGPISDAARLFIERSHEIAGHEVSGEASAIEALCRKLDGIPLAIELAAARTPLLSVEQLERRLAKNFDLLKSRGSENERHGALESTIDWSYQLLDDGEKRLFESLSVFSDGFTLEACEAIGGVAVFREPLDLLRSLVEKSLVIVSPTETGPRYELLETIREFAGKHRTGSQDEELQRAHLAFYLELALAYVRSGKAEDRDRAALAIVADIENCRAAFAWALADRSERCGEFVCALAFYWQNHGYFTEGRIWLQRYLGTFGDRDEFYPRALRFAAFFAASQDDYDAASALTARLADIAKAREDGLMAGEALHTIAGIEHRRGNLSQAYARYRESLELFDAAAHDRNAFVAILNMVTVLQEESKTEGCEELLVRAEQLSSKMDEDELTALVLQFRGNHRLISKQFDEAEGYARRAMALFDAAGGARRVECLGLIAEIQIRRNLPDEALELVREGMALSLEADEQHNVIRFFEVLALALFAKGLYEDSLRYYCSAAHLRESSGYFAQRLDGAREFERELRERTGEAFDRAAAQAPLDSWRVLAEQRL